MQPAEHSPPCVAVAANRLAAAQNRRLWKKWMLPWWSAPYSPIMGEDYSFIVSVKHAMPLYFAHLPAFEPTGSGLHAQQIPLELRDHLSDMQYLFAGNLTQN